MANPVAIKGSSCFTKFSGFAQEPSGRCVVVKPTGYPRSGLHDADFDLPVHFLPEFPLPMYLTTRPDLGDVSQGNLITIENYYELFNGIVDPKELEGLRLLL